MMNNAKPMACKPKYRSRVVKAKRGRGSYKRDAPTEAQVKNYIDLMDELVKDDDTDIDKGIASRLGRGDQDDHR